MNALEWYPVARLLDSINSTARSGGLRPEDIINLGGNAVYCWMSYYLGPNSVTNFRGTHDLDFLVSNKGLFDYVLDSLKDSGGVKKYENRSAIGLEDKYSYDVIAPAILGFSGGLEIDVYAPSSDGVRFNRRVLSNSMVVREVPVDLGFATVPSLFDLFLLKMDICLDSRSGLRGQDGVDIAAIAVMAGNDFPGFIKGMIKDSCNSGVSIKNIRVQLDELYKLFKSLSAQDSSYKPILEEIKQERANYCK